MERGGESFRVGNLTQYQLVDFPYRIVTFCVVSSSKTRSIAIEIDQHGVSKQFYDSGFIEPECGVPDLTISNVSLNYLSMHPLVTIDERRYQRGCCGGSTKETIVSLFFDAARDFRKILGLQKSFIDYNDDECGTNGSPEYRHTDFFPNGCAGERNCSYISFFTLDSDKNNQQQYFSYSWNMDSTALITK